MRTRSEESGTKIASIVFLGLQESNVLLCPTSSRFPELSVLFKWHLRKRCFTVPPVNAQNDTAPFILVAEDSPDDRLLLQYAFRSARLPNRYHIVNNGAEAITWLTNAMEQPNNPTFPAPGLLVLD